MGCGPTPPEKSERVQAKALRTCSSRERKRGLAAARKGCAAGPGLQRSRTTAHHTPIDIDPASGAELPLSLSSEPHAPRPPSSYCRRPPYAQVSRSKCKLSGA